MTLTETVQDAKQRMNQDYENLARHAKAVDALMQACQRSHRCWPSRVSWALLIGLLSINWVLAQGRVEEDMKRHQALVTELSVWKDATRQEFAKTLLSFNASQPTTHATKRWWQR